MRIFIVMYHRRPTSTSWQFDNSSERTLYSLKRMKMQTGVGRNGDDMFNNTSCWLCSGRTRLEKTIASSSPSPRLLFDSWVDGPGYMTDRNLHIMSGPKRMLLFCKQSFRILKRSTNKYQRTNRQTHNATSLTIRSGLCVTEPKHQQRSSKPDNKDTKQQQSGPYR
jgi:hypothetical protein